MWSSFSQKEMRNLDKHMEEGKRLESSLEELLQDAPDSDAAAERKRLRELMARFQGLRPNMDSTLGKSSIFTKGFEFRDNIDRKNNWLDEAQRLAMENPVIDSLDDARAYLQEHEVCTDDARAYLQEHEVHTDDARAYLQEHKVRTDNTRAYLQEHEV